MSLNFLFKKRFFLDYFLCLQQVEDDSVQDTGFCHPDTAILAELLSQQQDFRWSFLDFCCPS